MEAQRRERELEEKSLQLTATLDNLSQGARLRGGGKMKTILMSALFWLALTAVASAATGDALFIQRDNVTVRQGPSLEAPVSGHVNRGDRLYELGRGARKIWPMRSVVRTIPCPEAEYQQPLLEILDGFG